LAGAGVPDDRILDGRDIGPLLEGRFDEADPERVFCYYLRTHLQAVRQGKWKLHLARPARLPWMKQFSPNRHIAPADDVGMPRPVLYDLEADVAETTDVAADNPDVVARLSAIAEAARADIGDHDRVGRGARFFDEGPRRPDRLPKAGG